jgi:tetratricopeptide (TPR) repeat protein
MRCAVASIRVGCVFALFALDASGASTWLRVASSSVEIFTDSGERAARTLLDRFETLRRVFEESHIAAPRAPLLVFLFSTADEYRKYRMDPAAAAFYRGGDDRDLIVLYEGNAFERTGSHEYLHMVVRHASAVLPPWMEEGIPEFYSTVSASAAKVRIGDPIESHLSLLASSPWLSAADLALGNRAHGQIFYAESWALVHMLSLSPAWNNGMPEFLKLLNEGREQEEAFTTAFGRAIEDALKDLRRYVRNLREITVPAPPRDEVRPPCQVTRLAPVDATLALAGLALRTEHADLARSLFIRAAKQDPQSPAAAAGLGELALAENRKHDAQREFERAVSMGYRAADTYFQLAMLNNDDALLNKALDVDPNFAEAHFLLGVHATGSGNFRAAIDHLRQAVAIQPRRFTYWDALGYAQVKSGDRQGAAEAARRTVLIASNGQEEEMAAALTLLAAETPAIHAKKPDVTTPLSWQNRKGDARLEGTLTRVDCDSVPLRLVVSAGSKTVELNVTHPTEVVIVGAENTAGVSTTLACGAQSRPVAVEYLAGTREITRIEFRRVVIIKR